MKRIEIAGDLRQRMEAAIRWQIEGRFSCGLDDGWMLNDLEHTRAQPRTSEDFTGDVWGAHIETMAVLSRITGERYPQTDGLVRKVLENQQSDGSFWSIIPSEAEIPVVVSDNRAWGWQRALIGLVEYYITFNDEAVLRSAVRLADFLLNLYERSKTVSPDSRMARTMRGSSLYPPSSYWTAITQGLIRLYQVTNDEEYLTAAIEVADSVPGELLDVENTTDWLAWHGLILVYEETGERKYLDIVKRNVKAVMRMMTVLGDTPHLWFWPHSNEACGLADSITLNCDLWRATLDPCYMDAVERVVYNAFSASMYPSQGWGRYYYGQRVAHPRHADPQEEECVCDRFVDIDKTGVPSCCDWHVPIAFRDITEHIYRCHERSALYVNLFVPSSMEFSMGETESGAIVRVEQQTRYPEDGVVILKVDVSSPMRFPLHLRIPYWAENTKLWINGQEYVSVPAGQYTVLDQTWHHDVLRLVLPMPVRVEQVEPPWGQPVTLPEPGVSDQLALLKGPVVLVLDKDRNADISPLWRDADIAGIRPSLVAPVSDGGSSSFELPQDQPQSVGDRSFTYPASHCQGLWQLDVPGGGCEFVKGYLSPLGEVTGTAQPSHVQFGFQVRWIDRSTYQQYDALLHDGSFRMSEGYHRFIEQVPSEGVWVSPLLDLLKETKDSYSAALAVQRLGYSQDDRALGALVDCLRNSTSRLVLRMALLAVRQMGRQDQNVIGVLQELARREPELRAAAERTLVKLGVQWSTDDLAGSMSWIDGPEHAQRYLVRKELHLDLTTLERIDLRVASLDLYEIAFNGQVVGLKPTWANAKYVDLTPFACKGENELVIKVMRQPIVPDAFAETWTLGAACGPEGIIAKVCIKMSGTKETAVYTDDSWLVAPVLDTDTARVDGVSPADRQWVRPTARQTTTSGVFAYSTAVD